MRQLSEGSEEMVAGGLGKDQNLKYKQSCDEFPVFCSCISWPGLKGSVNLGTMHWKWKERTLREALSFWFEK